MPNKRMASARCARPARKGEAPPDGKLYFGAETFSEAAELLLLGHAWGRVVEALVS